MRAVAKVRPREKACRLMLERDRLPPGRREESSGYWVAVNG